MLLPFYHKAIIDAEKIRGYTLNPSHERGKHKAKLFQLALGFDTSHTAYLIQLIKDAISYESCEINAIDQYGTRYSVTFLYKNVNIKTIWIILVGEKFPRLVSCYILK